MDLGTQTNQTPTAARVVSLYRHPVKGFTPEALPQARLQAGQHFPCDRRWAIELGPSGYAPESPTYLKKTSFTVLANRPALAALQTSLDEQQRRLTVTPPAGARFSAQLDDADGRHAFATWLSNFLGETDPGRPLRVIESTAGYRFMDDAEGHVSMVNLASLRQLGARLGLEIDPLRFRANIYVDGWSPWSELDLAPGTEISLGGVKLRTVKPIKRCVATHVNTRTGQRDLDIVPSLMRTYGHPFCGVYLSVLTGGLLKPGDPAVAIPPGG